MFDIVWCVHACMLAVHDMYSAVEQRSVYSFCCNSQMSQLSPEYPGQHCFIELDIDSVIAGLCTCSSITIPSSV